MGMSNSSLVSYMKISPNSSARTGKISKITPHHMAGNLSVETCGEIFSRSSRQASANYGIGSDGRIALYVDESRRSWASSNAANDQRAVTIEVANSSRGGDWPVSAAAWNSLVALCVDICRRNGIARLDWTGDASGSLTTHDMFAATACPGPYLKARMPLLAKAVNERLGAGVAAAGGGAGSSAALADLGNLDYWGPRFSSELQRQLGCVVDGIISRQPQRNRKCLPNADTASWEFLPSCSSGSPVIRALQGKVGTSVDGWCGPNTVKSLQSWLSCQIVKVDIDGVLGKQTCRAMGKALLRGAFRG